MKVGHILFKTNDLKASFKAFENRFACCGVKIILDFTFAFGTPGITLIKSTTNSETEWFIIAKLE